MNYVNSDQMEDEYVKAVPIDLSVYDLKQQIEKLRAFIYKANNLKIPPEK